MDMNILTNKKLVLVDGSSYLFRAYHGLPPLLTSQGHPTGAIYGVINMLRKLQVEEKPDFMAVVFDTKSKNFRHKLYSEYKSHRPQMPEELSVQIAPLHEMIQAMGIPLLAIEGFEADDVIGTLTCLATQANLNIVISTGDKDLAQLVSANVTLVNTMTGIILDEKNVLAKFGVTPKQMIDYLALVGDPVDNIPGVPKVGPKTAVKWLEEYGSLENIEKSAAEIKGKVGEYLRAHLEHLPLSRKLVTVLQDVPLTDAPTNLVIQPVQIEKLRVLLEKFEFKTWLRELKSRSPSQKNHYQIVYRESELLAWLEKIKQKKCFVIDTETNHLNPLQAELVGLSLACDPQQAAYIPLTHHYLGCPAQLDRTWVLEQLKPILQDETIGKIGQHIKYDMHVLANYGIEMRHIAEDTMLESYVLNSVATRHDMDSLAEKYLHYQTIRYEEVAGKGQKQVTFDQVEIEKAAEYAAEDADITLQLHQALSSQLIKEKRLNHLYREIEIPLIEVLWRMEQHGVCIDIARLQSQSKQMAKQIQALEEEAYQLAGGTFNLNSPKQLQEIFYQQLKLPILEKTPKGAPSTAEHVLQELSLQYPLPRVILNYRTLTKLKSTYTDKLPQQVNPKTQRVHTSYHQAIAATGRLSSSDPNLQNIPIRTEEGRKIRQAFIAQAGYVLLAADYSQIELRIMAHLSQDPALLAAFQQSQDVHRFTASEIFQVKLEEVTSEQRRSAKAINFGLIYGMSAFGLARQLNVERSCAQVYMDQYFHRYPQVKNYMDTIRQTAQEQGYVETLLGRRLYLPDIQSKQMARKKAAERTAINAPMQGSAADIIKKAMIAIHQQLNNQQDIKMIMQVHDELVFEVKQEAIERAKALITHCMQNVVQLAVPLIIDIGVGANWDQAH